MLQRALQDLLNGQNDSYMHTISLDSVVRGNTLTTSQYTCEINSTINCVLYCKSLPRISILNDKEIVEMNGGRINCVLEDFCDSQWQS